MSSYGDSYHTRATVDTGAQALFVAKSHAEGAEKNLAAMRRAAPGCYTPADIALAEQRLKAALDHLALRREEAR